MNFYPTRATKILDALFRHHVLYVIFFVFCLSIFLVHYFVSGQAVYGDGIGYYAHLRSWVIDGDWNYTNEYKHIYNHSNNNSLSPQSVEKVQIVATTSSGQAENHYSPGVAVLLLPFFLLAHLITQFGVAFHYVLPQSGYNDLYQITTGVGAVCYITLSMWLLEQILKYTIKDLPLARLTTFTIFFATHLLYYGSFDVINSHFASFFLIVLFFYVEILKPKTMENIFFLGLIAGLLTVNRLQDEIIVFIWLVLLLNSVNLKIFLKKFELFVAGFLLALWPLLYHWHNTFNNLLDQTYVRNLLRDTHNDGIDLFGSLFHPVTGLFSKAPLLFVAFVYFLITRKHKKDFYLQEALIFFCGQVSIITIQGGWYAAAYGGRMYISSLIFFAFILGDFFLYLKEKAQGMPYLVATFFTLINILSIGYFIFIQK